MTTIADFSIEQLAGFLSLSLTDERLIAFLGPLVFTVKRDRDSYYAFLPLPEQGVDLVFNEAPWVLPRGQITDEKALHLATIHFHRDGHEEYGGYRGPMPNDVEFNDSEIDVRRKMGEPSSTGGGGTMTMPIAMPIPRWLKYRIGRAILHLQVDQNARLEMATLMVPDVRGQTE